MTFGSRGDYGCTSFSMRVGRKRDPTERPLRARENSLILGTHRRFVVIFQNIAGKSESPGFAYLGWWKANSGVRRRFQSPDPVGTGMQDAARRASIPCAVPQPSLHSGRAPIGHFGDRIGRRSMLILTMSVMGAGTFLIGCLPTYH